MRYTHHISIDTHERIEQVREHVNKNLRALGSDTVKTNEDIVRDLIEDAVERYPEIHNIDDDCSECLMQFQYTEAEYGG